MSATEIAIGIVGYGTMGRAHSYAYAAAPLIRDLPCRPRLRMMSGRNRTAVRAGGARARRRAVHDRKNAIGFNYRRLPALALMKQMVETSRIGRVRLWRGSWLSDEFVDPELPFDWRFERSVGASTIADLGAHLIDLAGWLVGEIDAVSAQSKTFTEARRPPELYGMRRIRAEHPL